MTAIQETLAPVAIDHADHHHEHPSWLAHHFDDAEQQYDSGKLGMWLFLVTEVLFFSGMFCAYALYRNRNPEVFEFCSSFLNEKLGAINTGVLLFSSLTMAWAVRAAQLRQHQLLVGMLGATLGCAAIFLGVKAVEYSHKMEIGLLPGKLYVAQLDGVHGPHKGYLEFICTIPAICTALCAAYAIYAFATKSLFHQRVAGPMLVAGLCFFGGVGLGQYLEAQEEASKGHGGHGGHQEHHAMVEGHVEHGSHEHAAASESAHTAENKTASEMAANASIAMGGSPDVYIAPNELRTPNADVNQRSMAGLFFSIYYCMTGVHAIHIIGGMIVITWLIVKAARQEFHEQYFGPVDNVGLYWHLVDFIWIYLFPLLYLIT
ncbi:MAG: cytochrome c oxidase subunit 3 [Planctomycetota bacterium]|nr:cytochrome c oxidase subunit 3 [Planctomycetota bacterium]